MTGTRPSTALIDPTTLAATMAADRPAGAAPVLLDVRWSVAGPQRDAYLAGHLPGAVFADLDDDLAAPPGRLGRHPLPDPVALQGFLRSAGVSDGTPVVVYDGSNSSIAARAWWLLRWAGHRDVRVLDGGYRGWQRAGMPVETGVPIAPTPGSCTVRPGSMPVVDIDGAAAIATGDPAAGVLLDARAAERYRGEVEPLDPVAGHIPGAVSLPLTDLVTEQGVFRDPDELAARFAAAGVIPGVVAVASCGSGVTACHLILAGELAGLQLALYPGSYSGWCAAGRPVATTP
ncbi:sulfurtransferase [Nakamurella lactea]|uniref:sulfurtransferase n=1 Tax=Nakamurella lactea TaxID=459515 RepID=UPI00048B1B37|nr:sulfurtransferase [Nakamurella lactea]